MSSIIKFFRKIGNQIKSVLGLTKSEVVYQAFASEEQFQIACRTHDELQFRRICMAKTAAQMRKARRQGCRAKHRWNKSMVRKVAHKCYDIPSCWQNGKYVYNPCLKAVSRVLSLVDLREKQDDVVAVTRWTKCRKDSPRNPFLDPEEEFSAELSLSLDVPKKKTRSSVSALFSRVLRRGKVSSRSVAETPSGVSFHPYVMVPAPLVETPEMLPEQDLALAEMSSAPGLQSPEMMSAPDVQCPEIKSKPSVSCPAYELSPKQLECIVAISKVFKDEPKRIDVDAWTARYRERCRQHYMKFF